MHKIGIRREDKDQWECRVPLVPKDVEGLAGAHALEITVQPSAQRVFTADEFTGAGATVAEDLGDCDVVMAVKEIPLRLFEPRKTYIFFSHTIKGQPYNMDMLRRLVELDCSLLDYEKVTDAGGRRLIFFSRFAGLAGTIDSLWALGKRLAWEGITPNPFAAIKQTYEYPTLADGLAAVREAGKKIAADGLPAELCPFVVGVTGYGNVSIGAQEVLEALGAVDVAPDDLDALFATAPETRACYQVVFREEHMVARRDSSAPFDLGEYYKQPELYEGTFDRWLPKLAMIINGIYWDTPYPRLVTREAARKLFAGPEKPRLRVIGDISCDMEGSIEFTVKETHIDNPVFVYDPSTDQIADGVEGEGPVVMSVGNLPCELSREASEAFSEALLPFIPALAATDFDVPFDELALPPELKRALILHLGEFTPDFAYMQKFV
jgi:alanine dehydrogenase